YVIATMLGCRPVQHQASNFKTAELKLCSGETFRATTVVHYYVVATEHGSYWIQPQTSGSKAVDAADLDISRHVFRRNPCSYDVLVVVCYCYNAWLRACTTPSP